MKLLTIVLLLTCIILIVSVVVCYFKDSFKNTYRLGDFVLLPKKDRRKYGININNIFKNHGDSIGALYFKKTKEHSDIDALVQVLKENNLIQPNNKTTMHIRLGDVLCEHTNTGHDDKKPLPINSITEFINNNSNRMINVYSFLHYDGRTSISNPCEEKSMNYINKLKYMKNVRIHLNGDPDSDFIDMINSKLHISGTGNYSKLINLVRQKLNLETIYIK